MGYVLPSLSDTMQFLVAAFKGSFPDRNIGSRFGFYWKLLRVFAGGVTDLHAKQAASQRAVMPSTARGDTLLAWCSVVGITPKGATPARKSKALRVRGAAASTVAVGDSLVHRSSGLRFQANQAATIPALGYIDIDVIAIDTGAATRLEKGEVLEFNAPGPGIQTKAELQLSLDEDGYDAEQEGSLSARMLAWFAEAAAGGNDTDWVAWALAYTGVDAAFVYPVRAGKGSVDLAVLHAGSGSARAFTVGELADLLAYLKTKAPSQLSGGGLRLLTTVPNVVDIELAITSTGEAAYEFDWDDAAPLDVLSWNAGLRSLQFVSDRPSTMKAGDRIVLKAVTTAQNGEVLTIEALSGTDKVILSSATLPTVAPAAGDIAYAGGPLTALVRDAIIAHMNGQIIYAGDDGPLPASVAASTVNLRVLAQGIGTANPNGAYGPWSGAVLLSVLNKIATYARGVRKCTVITPVVDTDATDYTAPLDSQIGYITPGNVLVRRG